MPLGRVHRSWARWYTRAMCTFALVLVLSLAGAPQTAAAPRRPKPTPAEAKAFAARMNEEVKRLLVDSLTAEWVKSTYITGDTERAAAAANERLLAYVSGAAREARRFRGVALDPETARMLHLLRLQAPVLADPAKRLEMTTLAARMEGAYGSARDAKGRPLDALEKIVDKSRSYDDLLEAWTGWHDIARDQRQRYARFVELQNEAARGAGFADMGEMWRAGYDMPPADFAREVDRIWGQVKPLYDDLHCYVRARLQRQYGKERVPDGKPIPAHVLGNMWAQDWANVYPLVEPYPGAAGLDVDGALAAQGWDATRVVKAGEAFYTSLGFDPLPKSFWERSMLAKPRDREVVCHPSAWDVVMADDLRVKMCIPSPPRAEDLETIHHELGHDYYFHAYYQLPAIFQNGANDGFHEAIGDSLVLSMTPSYLHRLGLVPEPLQDEKAVIDEQMKAALSKVAFLPFGKLIDQWRWDVFSGRTPPADYNRAWWALRERIQGVAPPTPRTETDFDAGAKYHVVANVPYVRYFLAAVLQFQFYRSLCRASGYQGPLHGCSFYGSQEAGRRLWKMLSLGASRPWPDALEAMTGERQMDGSALLEYFAPLRQWLEEQNRGQACGW